MLSVEAFEKLLSNPESSVLDFKTEHYDFSSDQKIARFVKDVICFSNTIRTQSSYIIIGVKEEADGNKTLLGIQSHIDESIFQDKVKSKMYPLPVFSYYTLNYENKTFGVFEFPIHKYSQPLLATVKMAGLEPGKVYYRSGATNSEALFHESKNIVDWLSSLTISQTGMISYEHEIKRLLNE